MVKQPSPYLTDEEILDRLSSIITKRGIPASVRDLVKACDHSSSSWGTITLARLERKGWVTREVGIPRSVQITELGKTINESKEIDTNVLDHHP